MSQSTEPIRVVVADDHPLFREGVITSLQSLADIVVVGQAGDAAGAPRVVREELPDLVLLRPAAASVSPADAGLLGDRDAPLHPGVVRAVIGERSSRSGRKAERPVGIEVA
jgi:DNA-binding NarL/FixJ family response regulator